MPHFNCVSCSRLENVLSHIFVRLVGMRQESFITNFPTGFSIGCVQVVPATVLAPMAGVTDTVFRRFIRNLAAAG